MHLLTLIKWLASHPQKRKKLSLNQKNKGAAREKPLFVVQGCLEMIAHCNHVVHSAK